MFMIKASFTFGIYETTVVNCIDHTYFQNFSNSNCVDIMFNFFFIGKIWLCVKYSDLITDFDHSSENYCCLFAVSKKFALL